MATITQSLEKRPPAFTSTSASARSGQRIVQWAPLVGAVAILLTTLVGLNIFVAQVFLYPQVRDYHANWHGAQWISVPNSTASIAYFRKSITLAAAPDSAFLTIQGQQTYQLFVNAQRIDDTASYFRDGVVYDTNIYDVAPFLTAGENTVALRVFNGDVGAAAVRAVLGITIAGQTSYYPSDTSWRSTSDVRLTQYYLSTQVNGFVDQTFDDTSWQNATFFHGAVPKDGIIPFNPATFELPMSAQWVSAGPYPDGYYYRSFNLPQTKELWMRIASTGDATVYINGQQLIQQPVQILLDQNGTSPPDRVGMTAGVYDVTPYMQAGTNTVAVHVAANSFSPGTKTLTTQASAMTLDILAVRSDGSIEQVGADPAWTAAAQSVSGWTTGNGSAQWSAATIIDGDTVTQIPPYKIPAAVLEAPSGTLILGLVGVVSALFILLLALGIALFLRFKLIEIVSMRVRLAAAVEAMGVVLAPTLALMLLLWIISFEPLLSRPFPATIFWLSLTLLLAAISFIAVFATMGTALAQKIADGGHRLAQSITSPVMKRHRLRRFLAFSPVLLLLAVGAYIVFYQLGYENYWQDELASIYAAKGVLHSGLPLWPTGILYTKSELFSYMLAVPLGLFGDGAYALRSLSALEYLASLFMVYWIGRYFFNRWVGLLAMAITLTSSIEIYWGRQARMYQQAQLAFLIVFFLFYRALQREAKPRDIYLAMAALVVMYLSHEETFIVLPAILGYFLLVLIRERRDFLLNKHWWIAGGGAALMIVGQLVIWRLTRLPIIGTDRSERPLIGWHPENFAYYIRLLLFSRSEINQSLSDLGDVGLIAMITLVISLFTQNRGLRYLAFTVAVSLTTVSTLLSLTQPRYLYTIQPLFALLAAWLIVSILQFIGRLADQRALTIAGRTLVVLTAILVVFTILGDPTPSVSTMSLATSRAFNLPFSHNVPDYADAGNYVKAHWQPGDIIISVAPAVDVDFYATTPTYTVYASHVLYVFEQNGHITNNYVGSQMIINDGDFNAALAKYQRIWIIMVNGGLTGIGLAGPAPILTNFAEVYEDAGAYVYLRTG